MVEGRQRIRPDGLFAVSQLTFGFGVRLVPNAGLFLFREGKEFGDRQPTQKRIIVLHGPAFLERVEPAAKVRQQGFLLGRDIGLFWPDRLKLGHKLEQVSLLAPIKVTN